MKELAPTLLGTHGLSKSGTYNSWKAMHRRCSGVNTAAYKNYGGRGIAVCERWDDFENFLADMGPRPAGQTIERIDNDAGYSPDNCCWLPKAKQPLNRRRQYNAKLCRDDIPKIRDRAAARENQKLIAADFKISPGLVSKIHLRKIYAHV